MRASNTTLFHGVKPYNKKFRNYTAGGYAARSPGMHKAQLKHDSIRAMLTPGEIIIPLKYAKKVAKLLKKSKIRLPGLK